MNFIYLVEADGVLSGPVNLPVVPGAGQQIPANGLVLEQPLPQPDAGKVWAFDNTAPLQLEDCRGTYYSTTTGAEVEHASLGPMPDGLTKEPRPSPGHHWQNGIWVRDLQTLFAAQTRAINQACERAITSGFTSSALGEHYSYSSQLDDQLNLTGAVLRGVDMPYACRDELGAKAFRLHTAAQLRQVGDDFTLFKLQLLQHANELKQQLDLALAAGDAEALAQIRWEAVQP